MRDGMQILKLCAVLLLLVFLSGCAIYHNYGPFYGKLIDRETKNPIRGAVILAEYSTQQYGFAGPVSHFLDTREVLANENGEFLVPSFHAIAFRPLSSFEPYPYLTIFKPNYICYPSGYKERIIFVPHWSIPENHFVIIEMQQLKNGDAQHILSCSPVGVPIHKMIKLIELENEERVNRGLEPIRINQE
jgi:hypothetical protein